MAPVGPGEFYRDVYERKGLHIKNRGADFLQGWLTSAEVLAPEILKQLKYGVDLDVTRFDGRKRLSVRPRGAADGAAADDAAFVRKAFEDSGATVRLRCPQQRFAAVHSLCAALEDEFGSTVGANAYLTPASGQGFAPHWDDVDVFVLQLEGSKRWRVYAPPSAEARLPRRSSSDFAGAGALKAAGYGAPHDVLLERGDVLYLPRGFVHEAAATEDASLHLTLSAHRDNSWADLLEEAVPLALARAIDARPEMRRSLPRDYLHYAGLQHAMDDDGEDEDEDEAAAGSDDDDDGDDDDILSGVQAVDYDATLHRALAKQRKRRRAFAVAVRRELFEVLDLAASPEILDEAADEMAKRFIAERLPPPPAAAAPPLKPKKKGAKAVLTDEARVYCCGRRVARLCVEEGGERAVLYHSLANATTHRGAPVAALEFDVDDAPSIEALLASHPARPVRLCDLPHAEKEDRLGVAEALFEAGLLVVVKNPDDEDE
ncbi:cupin superfamily protein-domain-containing protein [Pelagophyceae sp. CCMP2097]|nr:cupin superfamily protein-domain-containing protein [Pelagophyceae sp. CCMP2097]